MAHLEGFDFGVPVIEEIEIDHDEKAREYIIKMYERDKRIETPTTVTSNKSFWTQFQHQDHQAR